MPDSPLGQRRGIVDTAAAPGDSPGRGNFLRLVGPDDPVPVAASDPEPDVVALLLKETRSAHTRTAYRSDFRRFFGEGYTVAEVLQFAAQSVPALALRLHEYKAELIESGVSEATVNRRLAAVRALLSHCYRLGRSQTDGRGLVRSEKVIPYRDVRGFELPIMRKLIALPDTSTVKGKRDHLLLRVFLENGLRCFEVASLGVADLSHGEKRLRIRGKGRGTKTEWVEISAKTVAAAKDYLAATGRWKTTGKAQGPTGSGPLFLSLDPRPAYKGKRLTEKGIADVVAGYGAQLGVKVAPHRLRHSAISRLLKINGGNIAEAQDFSRHANADTLQIYNDAKGRAQGKGTRKLSREL